MKGLLTEGSTTVKAYRHGMTEEVWSVDMWWVKKVVQGFTGPGSGRNSRLGGKAQHSLPPVT